MLRRLTVLLSVIALANPLCCCWGAGGAAASVVEVEDHGCCASGEDAGEDAESEEGPEHTCPHDLGSALVVDVQDSGKFFAGPVIPLVTWTDLMERGLADSGSGGISRSGYLMLTGRHPPSASRLCRYLI